MKHLLCYVIALGLTLCVPTGTRAGADFRRPVVIGSLTVYPDATRSGLFYYGPGDLALVHDVEGKPDLQLLQTRYTGSRAMGDGGATAFLSLLTFRVAMSGPDPVILRDTEESLRHMAPGRRVALRPLPIDHLATALVYVPVLGDDEPQAVLPSGHFESEGSHGKTSQKSFWTERLYTLRMDANTAQAFWRALDEGQVLLSVGYSFHTSDNVLDRPIQQLKGTHELVTELSRRTHDRKRASADSRREVVVRAGAFTVTVDAMRWPDLRRRIDINERVPPGYAMLDIHCYDFNNGIRPDLYLKRVEIEAQGVAGRVVSHVVTFEHGQPELYAKSLRFPFAVRLDQPYRYRLVEVGQDGSTRNVDWRIVPEWSRMLDVTSFASDREDPRDTSSVEDRKNETL